MLRVGLVALICLFFCSCRKLATPLEFAESQVGVEEGSPSIWRYLLAVPDRQNVSEGQILLLGGNQGYHSQLHTSVCVIPVDESVVLQYRRPVRPINVRGDW
jgi:hypothetical protein